MYRQIKKTTAKCVIKKLLNIRILTDFQAFYSLLPISKWEKYFTLH